LPRKKVWTSIRIDPWKPQGEVNTLKIPGHEENSLKGLVAMNAKNGGRRLRQKEMVKDLGHQQTSRGEK